MADEVDFKANKGKKKTKKKRKHETSSVEGVEEREEHRETAYSEEAHQLLDSLQDICKCFGVGGFCANSKKRKIETHAGKLSVLEDWVTQETVRSLSPKQQQRYIKELSAESLALLLQLKKLLVFVKRLQSLKGRKAHNKDLVLDVLLKDIKINPSLSIPERYCQIGLWSQVLQVNQSLPTMLDRLGVMDSMQESSSSSQERLADSLPKDGNPHETALDQAEGHSKDAKSFRDFYMDVVTSSFAGDLDSLRKDGNFDSKQVSVLIDCLEAGKDIWSDLEKDLLQLSVKK